MTVSTTSSRQQYNADGVTTAFSFSFALLTKSELVVLGTNTTSSTVDSIPPGQTTTYSRGGDYSVTLSNPGGTVTFGTAPSTGIRITALRNSDQTQDIDYVENDPFPAETHEEGLDRAALRDQERVDELSRAVRLAPGDDTSLDMTLPSKQFRKGTSLGFDSTGKPTTFSGFVDADQVPVTSFMETLLDAPNAATARATLNVTAPADRWDVTTGTTSAFTASPTSPTSLTDGETVFLRFHQQADTGATLNVNSTGAVDILDNTGAKIKAGQIVNGDVAALVYDSGLSGWTSFGTNPRRFGDQPPSYYTDITARLGYTPVNRSGDVMQGILRMKNQIALATTDPTGNPRIAVVNDASGNQQFGSLNSNKTVFAIPNHDAIYANDGTTEARVYTAENAGLLNARKLVTEVSLANGGTDGYNVPSDTFILFVISKGAGLDVAQIFANVSLNSAYAFVGTNVNIGQGVVNGLNGDFQINIASSPNDLTIENTSGGTIEYSLAYIIMD